MTDNITGKTILLLFHDFYGFQDRMRDMLLKLGAKEVVMKLPEGCKGSFRDTFTLTKPLRYLQNPNERAEKTRQLISEIDGYTFDIMLCITFMHFSKFFLDYLRKKNPNVKLFLFLWDKMSYNQPHYQDYLPKFDYVYSFDRDEAKQYGLRYYPDFYIDDGITDVELRYDIAFVGKALKNTMNRVTILYYVNNFCKEHGLKPFLYLKEFGYEKPTNLFIKKKWREFRDRKEWAIIEKYRPYGFLHKERIPYEQVDKIYQESKSLLDINHPNRQGMTINAITALAKGKKLITTNKRIKEEPFYDPDTIYILDDENPKLDIDFFKRPAKKVNMEHLRMDNWLKHILNDVD